jgi:ornithine--oxo-acid transaminase
VQRALQVNEGEGDFQPAGSRILAAYGQRTSRAALDEVAAWCGLPVVELELVDPWFYHLDTALAVLAPGDGAAEVAYYPPAFSTASQSVLRDLYPDAIVATAAEADVLGLNVLSDGRHIVMTDAAPTLADQFRERGYDVIGLEFSELLKGGGSVKCCVLELRR